MKALILCAGKGTRLGLKKTPKCMVKVGGKPVLEHLVNHLNKAGITEIIVNVHKDYGKIFQYFGTRLLYFYEPTLLGEHGTERALYKWLGDEYIVMNGDTLTNVDIKALVDPGGLLFNRTRFVKNGKYAGVTVMRPTVKHIFKDLELDRRDWYYFDCGTPEKLRRARKFFKKNK